MHFYNIQLSLNNVAQQLLHDTRNKGETANIKNMTKRIVVLFRSAPKGWFGTRNVQYTSNRISLYEQ